LERADRERVAIGHFNVSELSTLKAIAASARELEVPVMIGVSEGERGFVGVRAIAALVRSLREEAGQPIFLNADHTHSLEGVREAARAGFDEILFDASSKRLEENVRETCRAVAAIRSIDPSIVVEGEVGYIGSSSEILEKAPEAAREMTTPEEARQFVAATGVDVLAPAVGNMHGMLREMVEGATEKRLDLDRIASIKRATGLPLTLHGGSGTNLDDLRAAVRSGMTIVHINTELRLAWRRGVEAALQENASEIAPYKLLEPVVERISAVVRAHLRLFNVRG
jgi:fructose-bisphosphate aldolase class II